jgi:hypothetical protein
VLEFDDNNMDCERDDVFDEGDCENVVKLGNVVKDELDEKIGWFDGRGISKISTTSKYPLELYPPPKNILFVDDVDARK